MAYQFICLLCRSLIATCADEYLPRGSGDFVREPMSEKLGRLRSVVLWIVNTLLAAVLVICLLGSIIGLMVHAPELQSPHGTTQSYGEDD